MKSLIAAIDKEIREYGEVWESAVVRETVLEVLIALKQLAITEQERIIKTLESKRSYARNDIFGDSVNIDEAIEIVKGEIEQ